MDLDFLKSVLTSEINPNVVHDGKTKLASVLIVIYGKAPFVIMTEKPKHMKFHAGEVSFPGGKHEQQDSDLLDTALRETREEIGLSISRNQIIGQLQPVTTLNSGFRIIPFVSIVEEISPLSANREVEKIFHIPLEPFLKTIADDPVPEHNIIQEMYTFEYQKNIVWGASARMLKQISDSLKL